MAIGTLLKDENEKSKSFWWIFDKFSSGLYFCQAFMRLAIMPFESYDEKLLTNTGR